MEKPRRNDSVTYVWPTAKAMAPAPITGTDPITTPTTTPRKPTNASTRQRSLALYCNSTSPSSHSATNPNAM